MGISMREHFIISTKKISNFFHLPYFQRLSATFQFFSLQRLSVTFLLQLGGYVLPQAIDRHPLIKRKIVQSSHSKKKKSKKNLCATFQIFSKCHFLSHGEGVSGLQAISGHPYQPTSNYRKNKKKKKSKKKLEKKKLKKNLSATFQIFSKCHYLNFLSHWGGCVWIPGHK